MAGRDLSQDLFGTQAIPSSGPGQTIPAQPPATTQGRDLSGELFGPSKPAQPPPLKAGNIPPHMLLMGEGDPFAVASTGRVTKSLAETGGGPIPVMTGEAVGRVAGAPFGPVGVVVGGGIGSAAGELGRQVLAGEDLNFKKALLEGGMSLVPSAVLEGVVPAGRKLLSRVPEGVKEGKRLAAGKLRQEAPQLLKAEPRQAVGQMFEQVAKSGVKIDPQGLQLDLLDDDQFRVFLREVRQIPAGPGFEPGLGNRLAKGIESVRTGQPTEGFDIGELQQLRSRLMKQAGAKKEGAVQDVLALGTRLIDEGIESGRVSGPATSETIDLLKNARAKWRVIRQSDDLANMAIAVTRRSESGRTTFHLGKLQDMLEDAPQRGVMSKAAEVLNQHPSEKAALADLVNRFEKINIEGGANIGRLGGPIERMAYGLLGVLGARPAARERFMRLVEKQRGTITAEQFSLFLNQARRELQGAAGGELGLGESSIFFPPEPSRPVQPPQ